MSFLEYAGKVKKVGYEYHFSMNNKNIFIYKCNIDIHFSKNLKELK